MKPNLAVNCPSISMNNILHPTETVVGVKGLNQAITVLHVTDLHLTEADGRDPEALQYADEYRNLFDQYLPKDSPYPVSRKMYLDHIVQLANQRNVDAVVFTGDIIHYPSAANLEALADGLKNLRAPYLYTMGNHDWHFPHCPWNEDTRSQFYPSFMPFSHGHPAVQVKDIAGMRLIAVDNSNYQIDAEQLSTLNELLASPVPCLLFMHIPIYLPELVEKSIAKWQAPILMAAPGWSEPKKVKWQVRDTDASTQAFYDLIKANAAKSLHGIFSGHVHFEHEERVSGEVKQYVTMPGYEGCVRIVRLV